MIVTTTTTGTTNAYAGIYDINSSGRPGKLLIDFGVLGTANSSLNSSGLIQSAAAANGYYLTPGDYVFDFAPFFTTGSPAMSAYSHVFTGRAVNVSVGNNPQLQPIALSATNGARGDPANLTSYQSSGAQTQFFFTLSAT
jgi:hypothetical protein